MSVQVGQILEGKVTDIMNYGVFIKINDEDSGLVHISEVSRDYVEDIHSVLNAGDVVKVKVIGVDAKGKIALSIKKALPAPEKKKEFKNSKDSSLGGVTSFDDMLSKFLKDSDEKQLYLSKSMDSKRGASRKH